jgi:N-acetylglucosamine-6-phosphate deacetylase
VIASEWIVASAVLPHVVQTSTRITAQNGRIVAIEQVPPADGADRIAGTLLPGFVDLQVNGAGGHSVDEATPEALDAVAEATWRGGAVAFLPTLITAPWERLLQQVDAVARWIGAYRGRGATPLGLHLEGPFLLTAGAHDAEWFLDPTPARVQQLLAAARGYLRLVTLASARAGAAEAIALLRGHGVTCALGHCDRTEGFAECAAAGATAITHLFNAMGPMHHRDVGIAGQALDDDRITCTLIADGVHVHPVMVRNAFRILGPDRTVLVTDATAAAGRPDGEYQLAGKCVVSKDGVVRDSAGRLAGSALTMGRAASNFLRFSPQAGPWTLARIASENPARLAGAGDHGGVAVGKRAAFTLLGDDGTFTCLRG